MVRLIAFYLPQFHPIPENDKWWGKGFTDWNNVVKAISLFKGHYQPHIPADLGFYDLRLSEVRQAQADLARENGIYGFCYYHYWFNGKRLLERPFNEVLHSGKPDFPFCLCWANETWTRAWDGRSGQSLIEQQYCADDDQAHIEYLLPIFSDRRYIRVGDRPLFLVYRTELFPEPERTADIWRTAAVKAGIGDIFLARVESFRSDIDPASIGFDAAVEFAPDWRLMRPLRFGWWQRLLSRFGLFPKGYFKHRFAEYDDLAFDMLFKPEPEFCRYRCITPGFDNSPRREKEATIFLNSTPQTYGWWLTETLKAEQLRSRTIGGRLVFVNAWNEWAEGNHLEPDQRWGLAYLEAHRGAFMAADEFNTLEYRRSICST